MESNAEVCPLQQVERTIMIIPFITPTRQILGPKQPPHMAAGRHLMLNGISQNLFLKNWGGPEALISLKRLGEFSKREALYLVVDSDDEADYSIWIYRKKDRILFFARRKLVAHFKWSAFREGSDSLSAGRDAKVVKMPVSLMARTLALVA
jgi:hypothetical protein